MEDYVLNPAGEEFVIYGLDDNDRNIPLTLSKGPYYELLEKIPLRKILAQRQRDEENRRYEAEREKAKNLPSSPQRRNSFQSSPQFSSRRLSPMGQVDLMESPRGEFGPGDPTATLDFLTDSSARPTLYIRQWKIIRPIPLQLTYRLQDTSEIDSMCRYQSEQADANFISEEDDAMYFCLPSTVLYEYLGLYRLERSFSRVTRQVPSQIINTFDQTVPVVDLYSGQIKIGSFEAPRGVVGIPGQFYSLPSDVQTLIMSNLDPADLINFCNSNMNNRRLCQDPVRSIWTRKLLQINPNLDMTRIKDPFLYFMRYYYGGTVLTFGSNDNGELGRQVAKPLTFQRLIAPPTIGDPFMNADRSPTQERQVDLRPAPINIDVIIEDERDTASIDKGFVEIAAGRNYTTAITTNGELYTFGMNNKGQLGRPFRYNYPSESIQQVTINIPMAVVMVACGQNHTLILLKNGRVMSFGDNTYGKLGRHTQSLSPFNEDITFEMDHDDTPGYIDNVTEEVVSLSCGAEHSVILLRDGRVMTFGSNDDGQLGRVTEKLTVASRYGNSEPEEISFGFQPGFIESITDGFQIAAGYAHTMIVLRDGRVVSCGANPKGQLGRQTTKRKNRYDDSMENDGQPTLIPEFRTAINVACGSYHTLVLLQDGRVATFGDNSSGQLGRAAREFDYTPKVADGVSSATMVAASYDASFILLKNGTVLMSGNLIRMKEQSSLKFKAIPRVNTAIAISAGYTHATILTTRRGW